ncbi:hypothetical protein SPRG_09539 [Saprolegnia parasitica CBS 223.65]|uniref:START domain-containing protein n=1 Tax=Saprolegnia parasitica (strain CBS 223.65) TaxID=695850 RepID=A0A067C6U9_SAPPC|nr:hypothetical protein SPRG_09539 [Saprolegnia parasitica CBS 223.65]KDO24895.1 hypothetical protein SPRG_09539 [Saprolegnia parasitica CBS 223.65]|eukprot:XP_012204355.1 hypothetical protein SPRG_09539 [Saprolegnia parasitica CBS 223.65]
MAAMAGHDDIVGLYEDSSSSSGEISIEAVSAFLAPTVDFGDHTSSSDASPARKRPYQRPKQELDYLRIKHETLVQKLQLLQSQLATAEDTQPWKARAIEQAQSVQRSLQENARLKEMVTDQIQVIEALEKVLTKRPKFGTFPPADVAWKQAILSDTNREEDLEALLQHQYDKLNSEWIRYGLHDARDRRLHMRKAFVQSASEDASDDAIIFLGSKTVPLDFITMSNVVWAHKSNPVCDNSTVLQAFHPDLVYIREDIVLPDPSMPVLEARIAMRRYVETDRVVTVWRSIIDDKLHPHKDGHLICKREGWSVLHADADGSESNMQMCMRLHMPIIPHALQAIQPAVGTLTELLLQAAEVNRDRFGCTLHRAIENHKKMRTAHDD